MLKTIIMFVLLVSAYLLLWPVPVEPVSWQAPVNPGYTGDYAGNEELEALRFIDISPYTGPEDIAMGADGLAYVATHEGAIIKVDIQEGSYTEFAKTGGRPLGIEFGVDGVLYVADAYLGLIGIKPSGELEVLASRTVDGSAIDYADDLDVTADGIVYFSDASTKFGAKANGGTYAASLLDVMEHGPNGRLLAYDPVKKETNVLLDGYSFANGVALAKDDSYLLFVETGAYSVHKLWLEGERAGEVETILSNLPGFPDNINPASVSPSSVEGLKENVGESYWVGLMSPRTEILDKMSDKPLVRKIAQRLPPYFRPAATRYGFVMRIDGNGTILETLQAPSGRYAHTTGAVPGTTGELLISSLTEPRLAVLNKSK